MQTKLIQDGGGKRQRIYFDGPLPDAVRDIQDILERIADGVKNKVLDLWTFWHNLDLVLIDPYLMRRDIIEYLNVMGESKEKIAEVFPPRLAIDRSDNSVRELEYWEALGPNEQIYEPSGVSLATFDGLPENMFGAIYQLARSNTHPARALFTPQYVFRSELFQKYGIDELYDMFIKIVDQSPFFARPEENNELKRFFKDPNIVNPVLYLLAEEPELLTDKGRSSFFARKIMKDEDVFQSMFAQSVSYKALDDALRPSNYQEIGRGNYNVVYSLGLDTENGPLLMAMRMEIPGKMVELVRLNRTRPQQYFEQFRIHQELYSAMAKVREEHPEKRFARVPRPLFYEQTSGTLGMELIPSAIQLAQLSLVIGTDGYNRVRNDIRATLENTFEYWRTGNNGSVLFRHHDLHGGNILITLNDDGDLKDVYVIDFDFSRFCPSKENSNYVIISHNRKETFPDDKDILKML